MIKGTLVAQLLTLVLDAQGVDMKSVMETFPEEFGPRPQRSESTARAAFPWRGASAELTDSVRFLEQRHLIEVRPDGSLAAATPTRFVEIAWSVEYGVDRSTDRGGVPDDTEAERVSASGIDEGFGYVPLDEWSDGRIRAVEPLDPLDFDQPRLES